MIQLFRHNNLLTSFLLVPYTFILRIGFFWTPNQSMEMETAGALYNIFNNAFGEMGVLRYIAISLCIAFTAVLINRLVIKHHLMRNQTLLPGLTFIILSSWLEIFLPFSAIHIANYFVILMLLSVFDFSKRKFNVSALFDASFYLSLSVLFYSPYFFFIIPMIFGLMSLDRIKFNDVFAVIVGLLTPFILLVGILYFLNQEISIFEGFNLGIQLPTWDYYMSWYRYIPLMVYVILLIISIFAYSSFVRKNNVQVLKKFNVLYWMLFTSLFSYLFILDKSTIHLLTFSFPICAFIGILWSRINKIFIEEFLHFVIVGGIIYSHYNHILPPVY